MAELESLSFDIKADISDAQKKLKELGTSFKTLKSDLGAVIPQSTINGITNIGKALNNIPKSVDVKGLKDFVGLVRLLSLNSATAVKNIIAVAGALKTLSTVDIKIKGSKEIEELVEIANNVEQKQLDNLQTLAKALQVFNTVIFKGEGFGGVAQLVRSINLINPESAAKFKQLADSLKWFDDVKFDSKGFSGVASLVKIANTINDTTVENIEKLALGFVDFNDVSFDAKGITGIVNLVKLSSTINDDTVTAIEKLAKSMVNFNNVKIDGSGARGLTSFVQASEKIDEAKLKGISKLGEALEKFNSIKVDASGVRSISKLIEVSEKITAEKLVNIRKLGLAFGIFKGFTFNASGFNSVFKLIESADKITADTIIKIRSLVNALKGLKELGNLNNVKVSISVPSGKNKPDKKPKDPSGKDEDDEGKELTKQEAILKRLSEIHQKTSSIAKKSWKTVVNVLKKIGKAVNAIFKPLKKLAQYVGGKLVSPFKKLGKSIDNVFKRIARIGFTRLIRRAFQQIEKAISEATNNLYQFSLISGGEFSKSLDSLKTSAVYLGNSIMASLAPAINALAPIIDKIVDKFVAFINTINEMGAKLSGAKEYTVAKKVSQDFAEAADSAKELNNQLLGFDKINKLDDNNSKKKDEVDYGSMFETQTVKTDVQSLEDVVANLAKSLNEKLQSIEWDEVKKKAEEFGKKVASVANELIKNTDWKTVGSTISNGISTVSVAIKGFFDELDGVEIGKAINDAFAGFDGTQTGKDIAGAINSAFKTINDTLKTIKWEDVGLKLADIFNGLQDIDFSGIGESITNALSGVSTALASALKEFNWEGLAINLNDFFTGIDVDKIVKSVDDALNSALKGLGTLLENFDFSSLGKKLGGLLNIVAYLDWKQIGKDISESLKGFGDIIIGALETIDFEQIGKDVIDFITGIDWGGIIKKIAGIGGNLVGGLIKFIKGIGEQIIEAFKTNLKWDSNGDGNVGFFEGIWGMFKDVLSTIGEVTVNFVDPILDAFGLGSVSEIGGKILKKITDVFDWFGKQGEKIKKAIEDAWNKITGFLGNALTGLLETLFGYAGAESGEVKKTITVEGKGAKASGDGGKLWDTITGWFNGGNKTNSATTNADGTKTSTWDTIKSWFSGGNKSNSVTTNADGTKTTLWSTITGWFDGTKKDKDKKTSLTAQGKGDKSDSLWSTITSWFDGTKKDKDKKTSLTAQGKGDKSNTLWGTVTSWFDGTKKDKDKKTSLTIEGKGGKGDLWGTITGWFDGTKKDKDKKASVTITGKGSKGSLWGSIASWFDGTKKDKDKNTSATLTANANDKSGGKLDGIFTVWSLVKTDTRTLTSKLDDKSGGKIKSLGDAWDKMKSGSASLAIKVSSGLQKAFDYIVYNIVKVINGCIEGINKVLSALKSNKTVNKISIDIDMAHRMAEYNNGVYKDYLVPHAEGGIITRQVRGTPYGSFGEQGMEAILPLQTNTQWMDDVANKIVDKMGGNNSKQPVQIPIYIGNKKISDTVIDDINKRTASTGRCPIVV